MKIPHVASEIYEFGPFRVDPDARALLREGVPVPLLPKSYDVLLVLVRNSGRLLDKDFLFDAVWPDTHVEENNLARAISDIRRALGEGPKDQRYVVTVPRRGYRFAAGVTTIAATSVRDAHDAHPASSESEETAVAGVAPLPRQQAKGPAMFTRWWLAAGIAAVTLAVGAFALISRSAPPPRILADRDVLVLADFTNHTGDPVFDGTLREALAAQLERSPFISVMSEARVRQSVRRMGRDPDLPLTNQIAREVCVREREKAMLSGSIAAVGSSYVIVLHTTSCETGETLSREQSESTGKAQVLAALATAATRTRQRLGDSLGSIAQPERHLITEVSTPSLEAFQAYARGADLYRRGLSLEAIPLFQRATELDSGFAMAFHLLGNAYDNIGERSRAIEYSQRAFALAGRSSEWERLAISAVYHMRVTGDLAQSENALQLFLNTFPRAPTPRAYRGALYMSTGRFDRAAEDYKALLALDRWSRIGYMNLMDASIRLDQFDRAVEVWKQASTLSLDSPGFHQFLLETALIRDDDAGAAREIAWFRGTDDEYVSDVLQASRAIVRGQRREGSRLLRRAAAQLTRENLHETAGILSAAAAADPFGDCQTEDGVVFSLRACPDIAVSSRDTELQLKDRPADTLLATVHVPMRRAAVALRQHQPSKAVELLASAEPFEQRYAEVIYLRGLAFLELKKGDDATNEFRKLVDHKGVAWGPRYPLAYLGLARAAAQRGATEDARKYYRTLLALWRDADEDLSALVQARAEFATLNEATRSTGAK